MYRTPSHRMPRVATDRVADVLVVGAGISGAIAARRLSDDGHEVIVLDKGRGPGGRMSTRRGSKGLYDHGAQYFTARTSEFGGWVREGMSDGSISKWDGEIGVLKRGELSAKPGPDRWVGVPAMSRLVGRTLGRVPTRFEVRVHELRWEQGTWHAVDDEGSVLARASSAIVTVPAPQAGDLVRAASPALARKADDVDMSPCIAAMVAFDDALEIEFDGIFVHDSPVAWAARCASRPGRRSRGKRWVLHASTAWSERHVDDDPNELAEELVTAFGDALRVSLPETTEQVGHRWRFARATEPLDGPAYRDPASRLVIAGDWCAGGRVEGAWRSGVAAARLTTDMLEVSAAS